MYGLFLLLPAIQVSCFSIANRHNLEDIPDDLLPPSEEAALKATKSAFVGKSDDLICTQQVDMIILPYYTHHTIREAEKMFVRDIATAFVEGNSHTRVAIIAQSDESKNIKLENFTDIETFIDDMMITPFGSTGDKIHKRIKIAKDQLLCDDLMMANKFLLIMTDDKELLSTNKEAFMDLINTEISMTIIIQGHSDHVFDKHSDLKIQVIQVEALDNSRTALITQKIVKENCKKDEAKPPLEVTTVSCNIKLDVVILLDSNATDDRDVQLSFINKLATSFGTSKDLARVAFVLYNEENDKFYYNYLDEYSSNKTVVQKFDSRQLSLSRMELDEGVNLITSRLFDLNYGARFGVPKILLIVTDNPGELKVSENIFQGLEKTVKKVEVIDISMSENLKYNNSQFKHVYKPSSYDMLFENGYIENVPERFCRKTEDACNHECQIALYQNCSYITLDCDTKTNKSCQYLQTQMATIPICDETTYTLMKTIGKWNPISDRIQAFKVVGSCEVQLARKSDGSSPFKRIFASGLHGLKGSWKNGTEYFGNAKSIKLNCPDVMMMMMPPRLLDRRGAVKEGYSRNAGVVISVGFMALVGSNYL